MNAGYTIYDETGDITKEQLDALMDRTNKRINMCKNAPKCPRCNTEQVQLVSVEPVEWRCRECKHRWKV